MSTLIRNLGTCIFQTENKRNDFWDGRAGTWSRRASCAYILVALVALIAYVYSDQPEIKDWSTGVKLGTIGLGVFISAGPPAWFWLEARSFDSWVNKHFADNPAKREELRHTYSINADFAKGFWAAVISVYAAVLLKF